MSATFTWVQDSGTATGSPAHGTTRTEGVTDWNFKNADNPATAYSSAPITAGSNSYHLYGYVKFSGTFNDISSVKFAHTAGTLGTGLTLVSKITSTYSTPATSALSGSTDITSTTAIGSGATVLVSTTGPEGSTAADTSTSPSWSQYIVLQLQTDSSCDPGDTGTATFTLRYIES